jgi:signal transduction histidine kinase
MKLLVKNFYILLAFSLVIFTIGGIIFYFILKTQIYQEIDQSLELEKDRIIQKLMVSDTIPEFYTSFENQITVKNKEQLKAPYQKICDTLIYDTIENDFIPFRKLETNIQLYTKTYKIDVSKSLINKSDLIRDILILMSFLFISLLIILMLVNFIISRRLLAPFYTTLGIIKNYQVKKSQGLNLPPTSTKEFALLNEVLNIMSEKIHSDFLSLKEFTENASHEMQTPLSIIRAKIEMLIQDETLNCEQLKLIQSINESTSRLSKMSRALVLITRIESLQYKETKAVNVNHLLDKLLENFAELIHEKGIHISKEYQDELIVEINPALSEILLTNLLSNSIKHNLPDGRIIITIAGSELIISNTGKDLDSNPDELFERFIKDKSKADSLGLGLSIVKKIVDTNEMVIDYLYDKGYHTLQVFFNRKKQP